MPTATEELCDALSDLRLRYRVAMHFLRWLKDAELIDNLAGDGTARDKIERFMSEMEWACGPAKPFESLFK